MSYVLAVIDTLDEGWLSGSSPLPAGGIKSKIKNFVQQPHVQGAFHTALHVAGAALQDHPIAGAAFHVAGSALGRVKKHPADMLAHAVTASLYHVAGLDFPTEVHDAIHHEIHNLSNNMSVATGMAHQAMTHAVSKIKQFRASGFKTEAHDDEIDELLDKLHKVLKKIEPHYRKTKQ